MTHGAVTLSAHDGLRLHARVWATPAPRGLVVAAHGHGEHGGRHLPLGDHLAERGYAVYMLDLRGHGLSEGARGHTPSFGAMLRDLDAAFEHGLGAFGDLPRAVYGHSLGGALALGYGVWGAHPAAGVAVTAPWLGLTHEPACWKIAAARIVNRLAPALTVSTVDGRGSALDDAEPPPEDDEDPLLHSRISVRLLLDFRSHGRRLIEEAAGLRCPALLIHGSNDEATSLDASTAFARRAGPSCELDVWQGAGHGLRSEQAARFQARLAAWLDRVTGG